ncbi:MAG TPA: hypothetical protein VGN11_08325 [Candidatus Baltobacteraceae bacterium]|jgi:hypothetical protein|nr:hypothetical protein [Candidatus Baltobacteraceae bacterium]
MTLVRELISRFIEGEGHKVDVASLDEDAGISEILFRTRGQVFSITTSEREPGTFTISTAYEIPDWAREQSQNAETLEHVHDDFTDVGFVLAHDDALFVATNDQESGTPEAFMIVFWDAVARVREAGSRAIELILDRTESKAAAEKFINSFMRGNDESGSA